MNTETRAAWNTAHPEHQAVDIDTEEGAFTVDGRRLPKARFHFSSWTNRHRRRAEAKIAKAKARRKVREAALRAARTRRAQVLDLAKRLSLIAGDRHLYDHP